MIQLTTGTDRAYFHQFADGVRIIAINGIPVLYIAEKEYGDNNFLERVFSTWLKFNYPPFWENPIKYFFGGKKSYDSLRILNKFYNKSLMRPNFNISTLAIVLSHLEDKKFSFKNISGTQHNVFTIEVTEPGGESYTGVYRVEGEEVKEIERK